MAKNPWVDVNDCLPAHGDVVVVRLTYPCDMEEYDGHEPWRLGL